MKSPYKCLSPALCFSLQRDLYKSALYRERAASLICCFARNGALWEHTRLGVKALSNGAHTQEASSPVNYQWQTQMAVAYQWQSSGKPNGKPSGKLKNVYYL